MQKSLIVVFCCLAAVATAASLPTHDRAQRDASELSDPAYNYLPPTEQLNVPAAESEEVPAAQPEEAVAAEPKEIAVEAATAAPADSSGLGENGYEYKTVRKLRFRQRKRRDVSHLNLGYLPPVTKSKPPKLYLPPTESATAAVPRLSNVYLPPVQFEEQTAEEDAPTEAPAEETEAPEVSTEAPTTEIPTTEAALEETAVFADDGYHYKRPEVVPDLAPAERLTREYLPPLEEGVVEAEGPGEETAVLADDGYHYRAIKRLRFF